MTHLPERSQLICAIEIVVIRFSSSASPESRVAIFLFKYELGSSGEQRPGLSGRSGPEEATDRSGRSTIQEGELAGDRCSEEYPSLKIRRGLRKFYKLVMLQRKAKTDELHLFNRWSH